MTAAEAATHGHESATTQHRNESVTTQRRRESATAIVLIYSTVGDKFNSL